MSASKTSEPGAAAVPAQPWATPCSHGPTPEEVQRDPSYLGCTARAFEPCVWARRWDGVTDPAYHSERFEAAQAFAVMASRQEAQPPYHLTDAEVLATGLV